MGDVHRLKKEVVGSIGRGTASPVRAMFSREISDGDTLLAGEMVGVDEGLVIQELSRPEELEKLQHELAKQVSKLAELGELKWLEELEKLETEELKKKLEEVKSELEKKKLEEVKKKLEEAIRALKEGPELEELKKELEELAAIKELKELGLEERLRELAEIKEVKRLAERQKAGEFGIQEGLQLTEKITALSVGIVGRLKLEKKLEEVKEEFKEPRGSLRLSGEMEKAIKELEKKVGAWKLEKLTAEELKKGLEALKELKGGETQTKIKNLKNKLEELAIVRALRELAPGNRAKNLEAVKATLKRLRALAEKDKLEKFKGKDTADLVTKGVGWLVGFVESAVIGQEKLGDVLKGEELVNLEKKLAKIKALEELTEIAEKRGVATVMRAALTSAMEITKNRGWTDYLNSLDVSERANAARELIAAEKIRKWARDINNLDADERAMVAGP
ncbi:hypothetical protein F0Q58_04755 [Anaplasma marginale]|nr:hypothetical protein F0Q58_04755 [Anaplasma marginale]